MTAASTSQQTAIPAVPKFILRGHESTIHALHFFASNAFLASGDGDGWIVLWSLTTKRGVAVWKGHDGGIMGIKDWTGDETSVIRDGEVRLVTHGRDHRLRVWRIEIEGFGRLDVKLPMEGADARQNRQPWLLHSMAVNALNFCTFALCPENPAGPELCTSKQEELDAKPVIESDGAGDGICSPEKWHSGEDYQPILIASPNGLDQGGIDIFHLPSEHRVCKLPSDTDIKTGMVMALGLLHHPITNNLLLVSGYEDGSTMVHACDKVERPESVWKWRKMLLSRPHTQPILSLDIHPSAEFYFTSSADAIIAKFDVPTPKSSIEVTSQANKIVNTKHAGQQGLVMRSDGKIFATAGWDCRVRVYSAKTLKEVAVLRWHKEACYAVAFAVIEPSLKSGKDSDETKSQYPNDSTELTLAKRIPKSALDIIRAERGVAAQRTHWIAAGGKDGKISLWDIY